MRALRTAGKASLVAAAAGIAYSRFRVPHGLPLAHAVRGERREIRGQAGRLSCYVSGEGRPMLLVHSINAAASAYEVKPIFERAMQRYRVYAPDLPGFGFSDRSRRDYNPRLYTDAVHDVLDNIAAEHGEAPVELLAVSLGAEFAARAAMERPSRIRTLALVTPTGFSRGIPRVPGLETALRFPLWSQALFDGLASRRSIRYFLEKTYGSSEVDPDLVDYDYATAHQPGARFAPLAFLAGRLFSRDMREIYERLTLPVWMPHATKGDFADYRSAEWVRGRPNWTVDPYPTGALPHFEQPDRFMADYARFLALPPRDASGPA